MKLELFAPTERYRGRGPHPVILQTEQIGHLDSEKRGESPSHGGFQYYPLANIQKTMENHYF